MKANNWVDNLDKAPKIDFNMQLQSKGLNKLIKYLFDLIPDKPQQKAYMSKLRECLRIVLINLNNTDGYISYSRNDHTPEYKSKKYSARNISKVVDFLSSNGFVENKTGYFFDNPVARRRSRMRSLDKLKKLFDDYEVNQKDIRIDKKSDLIILRDKSQHPIPYKDTDFTLSAKDNLKKINELLSYHDIIMGNGYAINRKALHRVFNKDFEHGGRFYGPEWQSLNGEERLSMKIDKSPVIELDFKALHPTILYAINGIQLQEDPYLLSGCSHEIREFLKVVMLILVNTGNQEKARRALQNLINKGNIIKPREIEDLKVLIGAFIDKHSAIKNLFDSNTGLKLQRLDADICEAVHMLFYQNAIPILSVHDSFIVNAVFEKKLYEIMEEVFYNKFKKMCQVTKKGKKSF